MSKWSYAEYIPPMVPGERFKTESFGNVNKHPAATKLGPNSSAMSVARQVGEWFRRHPYAVTTQAELLRELGIQRSHINDVLIHMEMEEWPFVLVELSDEDAIRLGRTTNAAHLVAIPVGELGEDL